MKFFFQFVLIIIFFLILFFLYNKYFSNNKLITNKTISQDIEMFNDSSNRISETQNNKTNIINETNNLIKNLKYEIQLSNNRKYIINSDLSELTFINKKEIIYMTNVMAVFIDKNNIALKIEAKKATFDSSTNNTKFRDNVNINYLDNYIFAEKVDLNFIENIILIHGNTLYKSPKGEINTDNIKIDLVNNNIFMYMNDSKKKIQFRTQ